MAESVSSEELQVVSSVAELYGSLSYCASPTSSSPTVVRALTSSIVSITVSLSFLLTVLALDQAIVLPTSPSLSH